MPSLDQRDHERWIAMLYAAISESLDLNPWHRQSEELGGQSLGMVPDVQEDHSMTPFFYFLLGFLTMPVVMGVLIWVYVRVVSGRRL